MVVENEELIMEAANETADKLLSLIQKEISNPKINDDPAESIYLLIQILSITLSKSIATLMGYRNIYGIDKMSADHIMGWVFKYAKDHLNSFTNNEDAK